MNLFNRPLDIAILVLLILCTLACTVFIVSGEITYASIAALLPLLLLFSLKALNETYLFVCCIVATHLLGINIGTSFITLNTMLIILCLLVMMHNKIDLNIVIDKAFLFFWVIYLSQIIISFYINSSDATFDSVHFFITNFIIMLMVSVFKDQDYSFELIKTILSCSVILLVIGIINFIIEGGLREGRLAGPVNAVIYSLYMAFGVPCAAHIYLLTKQKRYLIAAVLLLIGIVLSGSRGVMIALVFTVVIHQFLKILRSNRHRKMIYALVLLSFIIIATAGYRYLVNYGNYGTDLADYSSGRTYLYAAAVAAFYDKPIFGIGWDTYKKKWSKYVNIDKPVYGTDPNDLELNPHSSYLKIISELGLVGLLLFTFCLLLLLNKTLSYLLRDDFTAYFGILFIIIFHGFFDNNSYGNERIFYIIVGSIFAKIYYLNVAKSTLLDYQPTGKI